MNPSEANPLNSSVGNLCSATKLRMLSRSPWLEKLGTASFSIAYSEVRSILIPTALLRD